VGCTARHGLTELVAALGETPAAAGESPPPTPGRMRQRGDAQRALGSGAVPAASGVRGPGDNAERWYREASE